MIFVVACVCVKCISIYSGHICMKFRTKQKSLVWVSFRWQIIQRCRWHGRLCVQEYYYVIAGLLTYHLCEQILLANFVLFFVFWFMFYVNVFTVKCIVRFIQTLVTINSFDVWSFTERRSALFTVRWFVHCFVLFWYKFENLKSIEISVSFTRYFPLDLCKILFYTRFQ